MTKADSPEAHCFWASSIAIALVAVQPQLHPLVGLQARLVLRSPAAEGTKNSQVVAMATGIRPHHPMFQLHCSSVTLIFHAAEFIARTKIYNVYIQVFYGI